MTVDTDSFGTLAIAAIRYCQGRKSYMPELVIGIVKSHIEEISDKDLQVMINDCVQQADAGAWGDLLIDKPNWLKWRDLLLEEQKRRKQ